MAVGVSAGRAGSTACSATVKAPLVLTPQVPLTLSPGDTFHGALIAANTEPRPVRVEIDCCTDKALTTLYAEEKTSRAFLNQLRRGNFTCGQVGIKMAIGDTVMGGACSFENQTLLIAVSDFHRSVKNADASYHIDIINDEGVAASYPVSPDEISFFAAACKNCAFYRAEIFMNDVRIAIGNPIWNER